MADNKMNLNEAVTLASSNSADLSSEQLAGMNGAFNEAFFSRDGSYTEDVKFAAQVTLAESDARLEALAGQDSFDASDLDSIIALASSIDGFSSKGDMAKAVMAKAESQKAQVAAGEANEATAPEYEIGDESKADENVNQTEEEKESKVDDIAPNTPLEEKEEAQEDVLPEAPVEEKEETQEKIQEAQLEAELVSAEAAAESPEALAAYDKENGIDEITPEQLAINEEAVDTIEADGGFDPFMLDSEGKLANKQFQDEYDAFEKLVVNGEDGKPLSDKEQAKYKESLKEAALLEASVMTRGSAKGDDVGAQYVTNLKDSLQKAVVSTVFADKVKDGSLKSKEQFAQAFMQAVDTTNKEPLKTDKTSIMAYTGMISAGVTKYKDRIKAKVGEIPAVQKMSEKISTFDKNMTEKYGEKYTTAKRISKVLLKSGINVAKYTAISALAGPTGLALLAVKSAHDSYKGLKGKAEKEGQTLGQYAKAHKVEVALAFATTTAAALSSAVGLGALGDGAKQAVAPALKIATRALAVAPKASKALWHGSKLVAMKMGWMKSTPEKMEETKAAFKENLTQTAEAVTGMFAGAYLNSAIHSDDGKVDGMTGAAAVHAPTAPTDDKIYDGGQLDEVVVTAPDLSHSPSHTPAVDNTPDHEPTFKESHDYTPPDLPMAGINIDQTPPSNDDFTIEGMTHDNMAGAGVDQQTALGLEDAMAAGKANGDFSQADEIIKGLDGDAKLAAQDYLNAARGLSATGGEEPSIITKEEGSNMPSHAQMHDLGKELQEDLKEDGKIDVNKVLHEKIASGEMTAEQAAKAGSILTETAAGHDGDIKDALKDVVTNSAQGAKEEFEAQQAAERDDFKSEALAAHNDANKEMAANLNETWKEHELQEGIESPIGEKPSEPTVYKEEQKVELEQEAKEEPKPEPKQEVKEEAKEEAKPERTAEVKDPSKAQEEADLRAAQRQAASYGAKPGTEAYDNLVADKLANIQAGHALSEEVSKEAEQNRGDAQKQSIEDKIKEAGLEGKEAEAFRAYMNKQGLETSGSKPEAQPEPKGHNLSQSTIRDLRMSSGATSIPTQQTTVNINAMNATRANQK